MSPAIFIIKGSLFLSPLLFWHGFVYLPKDHYCYILTTNVRTNLWLIFVSYLIPLVCMCFTFIRMTWFLRHQPVHIAATIKRRQERDFVVIKRIFISIGTMCILGIPGMTIVFIASITGIELELSRRITWFFVEVSLAIMTVQMVLITPQLRSLIMRNRRQNRIKVDERIIQTKPITPNH